MKREEEINIAMKESVTETIYSSGYGFTPQATDLLECAWVKGAKWADKTMIERAVNWLVHNMASGEYLGLHDTIIKPDFIAKFKKAMKGE